jgi:hypothetical protein
VGFVVDKVALGQVSSEYFGFPCLIPPISPHSPSPIIWGWYNTKWTLSLTPLRIIKNNNINVVDDDG